jgi:hypothetical protein
MAAAFLLACIVKYALSFRGYICSYSSEIVQIPYIGLPAIVLYVIMTE